MHARTHTGTTTGMRRGRRWLFAVVAVASLAFAAPAHALDAPALEGPTAGVFVETPPPFRWSPVAGAARYEFHIAADAGFNAPVLGSGFDRFQTRNTRATLKKTIPNGTYWWRVRAVTADGAVSDWSESRWIEMAWATPPNLIFPTSEFETITYPAPVRLEWSSVPYARGYLVSLATDPELGSLVGGQPIETNATTYGVPRALAPGVYYWSVTPIDGGGHHGAASAVGAFRWDWPSAMATAPRITDIVAEFDEIFDPQFSWDAVPGAVGYDVGVFSSGQPDLKVCCDGTSIGTSLAPPVAFPDNTYFWRVRAIDAGGNAGEWNDGPEFSKAFAETQVTNLRMRDHLGDPGTDASGTGGYQTNVPIVKWDPVPGASSYEVEVTPYHVVDPEDPPICNWTASTTSGHWKNVTATTAWTPLGTGWNLGKPFASTLNVSNDLSTALSAGGSYCVRVRPRDIDSTILGKVMNGDFTYLNGPNTPAFQWIGPPTGEPCPFDECNGYLKAQHYREPMRGVTVGRMPLFTWTPVQGKDSYFVIVAKDPSFHTLVDYAFTQLPAYAPRTAFNSTTYQDETTAYYWAVLPAAQASGNGAAGEPLSAHPASFHKKSTPPTLLAPTAGSDVADQPVFEWTPVEGARRYFLQVSQDSTFKTILENNNGLPAGIATDATSYTARTTYPADTTIYWRVRGEDDKREPFVWSATGTFQRRLPAPIPNASNPTGGDFVPTIRWSPVQGASSYELDVLYPNGVHPPTFKGLQRPIFTPSYIYGTGIWKWRVRAHFPKVDFGTIAGPWTSWVEFTRTLREPPGVATDATGSHVLLSWQPKAGLGNGIYQYRVQISKTPDFSTIVEDTQTENTGYAPPLTSFLYSAGGTFYWRVASLDGGRNTGDYSATQSFSLPVTKASSSITVTVSKTSSAIRASGMVMPNHAGKTVRVTLARKRNGSFVKIAAKSPKLTTTSSYATSFKRPRAGTCRITARFPGDADHYPSTKKVKFSC